MTPQQLAQLYVKTINSPPNAWGQHCHPQYGQSHSIMFALSRMVGHDEAQRLIKLEMTMETARAIDNAEETS
jgi:hypothetical protein